jgi:hypothetical protein
MHRGHHARHGRWIEFPVIAGSEIGAVASTGLYAFSRENAFGGTYSFDWSRLSRSTQRHGLVEAQDDFYLLDYRPANTGAPQNRPYHTLAGAKRYAFAMQAGTTTFPAPERITSSDCSHFVGLHAAEATRFEDTTRRTIAVEQVAVQAVAHLDVGVEGAIDLAFSADYTLGSPIGNIDVTAAVANPIRGSSLVVEMVSEAYVDIRHPAASFGTQAVSRLVHVTPFRCEDARVDLVPASAIGIPSRIVLDGTPLDFGVGVDDTGIEIDPTRDLKLSWEATGPADWYQVTMLEVANEPFFDGSQLRPVRVFQTPITSLSIDPTSVVRGRYYIFEMASFLGLPDAHAGDLSRLVYPTSSAITYSVMVRAL